MPPAPGRTCENARLRPPRGHHLTGAATKRILPAAALALAGIGAASAPTYQIEPRHTQVHFTYSHHGYANLSGLLTGATGQIEFDAANPGASSIQVELPMSTLITGVPKLDAHLAS